MPHQLVGDTASSAAASSTRRRSLVDVDDGAPDEDEDAEVAHQRRERQQRVRMQLLDTYSHITNLERSAARTAFFINFFFRCALLVLKSTLADKN